MNVLNTKQIRMMCNFITDNDTTDTVVTVMLEWYITETEGVY